MKENKKVSAALRAGERWERYLLRRALGVADIVWAAVVAVAGFVTLKAEPIASAIGMSSGVLIGFTWLIAVVIAVPITVYFFVQAGRSMFPRLKLVTGREKLIEPAIGLTWFISMFSFGYLWKYIGPAALLIGLGIANALTFAIDRVLTPKATYVVIGGFPEQLAVGIMLLVVSPLIYAMGTAEIACLSMLAAIALAYCAGGTYSLLAAPRALVEKTLRKGR